MHKLMIVEDNNATREDLRDNINWKEYGIEVIAALSDGQEAVEHLEIEVPDVILTDIVMPRMDGLALSQKVKEEHPLIKIIILSAYEEFEYAQEALKTGVFDYIMKPFDYDQLIQSVQRALDEKCLDDELKDQVKKSIPILREKFLLQLVEEEYNDLVFMDDAKYLSLKFDSAEYICVLFDIDNIKQIKSRMKMEQFNIQLIKIQSLINANFDFDGKWVFRSGNNCILCILGFRDVKESNIYPVLYEKLDRILEEVGKKCDLTLSIGVGDVVSPICNISYSYQKARNALEYKFLMGGNKIFNANDLQNVFAPEHIHFPISIEEKFIKRVCLGDETEAFSCIEELKRYFNKTPSDKDYFRTTVSALVFKMFQLLYERGIQTEKIVESKAKMFDEIQNFDTAIDMIKWMEGLVGMICREVESCMFQKSRKMIQQSMAYIDRSYMDEELSLNDIAREVSLSPAYLSGIFKRDTKMNITDYILKVRMEKAQTLLLNKETKISEVSIGAGYSNQFYFSTCFKKYYGQSPNEFRNKRG